MSADILGTSWVTNAEAWFNNSLRPRKPEGSLGRTAQDSHRDSHTAPAFIHFSAVFYTAHCALDLARDHAPQKCPLLLFVCVQNKGMASSVFVVVFSLFFCNCTQWPYGHRRRVCTERWLGERSLPAALGNQLPLSILTATVLALGTLPMP